MGKQTVQVLNRLNTALGDASDYAVANALGVTRATVSKWRTGTGAMSDETAIKAAKILHDDPAELILTMAEDRATTQTVKAFYRQMADQLRAYARLVAPPIVAGFAVILGFFSPNHAQAQDVERTNKAYYVTSMVDQFLATK